MPQGRCLALPTEAGRATVALTKGTDRLAHAKASKDDETLHSVLLQTTAAAPEELRREETLRRAKIERLRAALADGSYSVTAEALAEKMIEHIAGPDSLHPDKDNS